MVKSKYMNIIKCLRRNARDSLTNMSKCTKAPVSTVHDRVRATERFIKRYTALLDYEKLGYALRTTILLKSGEKSKVSSFISDNPNVNSAFLIEGNHDFFLDCIFQDDSDFDSFMRELDSLQIDAREVYVISKELKNEHFLT